MLLLLDLLLLCSKPRVVAPGTRLPTYSFPCCINTNVYADRIRVGLSTSLSMYPSIGTRSVFARVNAYDTLKGRSLLSVVANTSSVMQSQIPL